MKDFSQLERIVIFALCALMLLFVHFLRRSCLANRTLAPALSTETVRELLYQPLLEIGMGYIFTFGSMFFGYHAFRGSAVGMVAVLIGLGVALASSIGSFFRCKSKIQDASEQLGSETLPGFLKKLQAVNSLLQFLLLAASVMAIASRFAGSD